MVRIIVLVVFGYLLFHACNQPQDLEAYTYRYTVESMGQFKVEFQLNPDSTFRIGRYNYFFDKFEANPQPFSTEGKLKKEEYQTFTQLIQHSRFDKKDDSYGFEKNVPDNSIVYSLELHRDGKSKFVVVNAGANPRLPDNFTRLLKFTGDFLDQKLSE